LLAGATPPFHFALVILEMGVSQTICLGWPPTTIRSQPPNLSSQVAKIISDQCLTLAFALKASEVGHMRVLHSLRKQTIKQSGKDSPDRGNQSEKDMLGMFDEEHIR
jgi:hypothetical protein